MQQNNKTAPNYIDYDINLEIENLKKFLQTNGIMVDTTFYEKIQKGDIIEVYSFPESKQIYCNSEFTKLCSYNLEQMTTIPFPQLFWRDGDVHLSLMKRAADICKLNEGVYDWNITNHELVESLHPRKRTFEMNMKKIAPCFIANKKESVAWLSTLQVELIYEHKENVS